MKFVLAFVVIVIGAYGTLVAMTPGGAGRTAITVLVIAFGAFATLVLQARQSYCGECKHCNDGLDEAQRRGRAMEPGVSATFVLLGTILTALVAVILNAAGR